MTGSDGLPRPLRIPIDSLKVAAYAIPTDTAESDGTFEWDSTMLVCVHLSAGNQTGFGYTYAHSAAGLVIEKSMRPLIEGADALDTPWLWGKLVDVVRNAGRPGIASHAVSAVDCALWDLKAKLLNVPLCRLWGQARESVPVYGSGGFTSYSQKQLSSQFESWKEDGVELFKMKVGRHPDDDLQRVSDARNIIGADAQLFVDANGAYRRKEALQFAQRFADYDVRWFEEPVSSDDLQGLRFLRDRAPAPMAIAAGEYGYERFYFRRMLESQAVDVLQADATRCGGFTGFFQACQLAKSFQVPVSSHTAPSLHLHACLNDRNVLHMEYFYDHIRIERKHFDGCPELRLGLLYPNLDRPGHGLELKEADVQRFMVR